MTELVACLSTGKGTWLSVSKLIDSHDWDKIFLVANDFAIQKFQAKKGVDYIAIDPNKSSKELVEAIKKQFDGRIQGAQVALNLESGSGKEHMALLSALLKLGVGIRLVSASTGELEEL